VILIETPSWLIEHLDRIADLVVVLTPLVALFIRWTRRIEGTYVAVKDVTQNHLPFIYLWLRQHNNELSDVASGHITLPDHPNIVLVPNGSK
jgi:hypothetical protein